MYGYDVDDPVFSSKHGGSGCLRHIPVIPVI